MNQQFTLKKISLLLFAVFVNNFVHAQIPNWSEHVAPILYKNCTSCHISGGIAPFSLVGYSNAQSMASSIAASTESKRMPPWPANTKYKRYAHERILSASEIETIKQWANNNTPTGNLSLAPANPTPTIGSQITNATIKLKIPNYTVNTSSDLYRCFVLPTNIPQNEYVTALEVIPGNRQIVHHVLVFQDTSMIPVNLDNADSGPGYVAFGGTGSQTSQLVGVYVPGQEPFQFPVGFGAKLLKNTRIILQIHYPGGINSQIDSTKVYLKTTTNTLRQIFIDPILNHQNSNMTNGPLYIPANEIKTFNTKYLMNSKATIFSVAPHMHLIGRSIKAYGLTPTNDTIKFIDIPKWDFHWQRTYSFIKPIIVQPNDKLWGEALYDNTTANPYNPNNPPLAVTKGEGTADEMMLIYFWYAAYKPGDENIVVDTTTLKNISSTVILSKLESKLSPNPIQNHLDFNSNEPITDINIFNLEGQLIAHYQLDRIKNGQIQISNKPVGMYIIELKSNEKTSRTKVMIE
jgi:hypothetical protein